MTAPGSVVMQSDTARLALVALKHPRDAFVDEATVAAQWRALHFAAPPDVARACGEFDRFINAVQSCGSEVLLLPRDERTTLDSIYVRDASIVCDRGLILCRMGKPQRAAEPEAQGDAFARAGLPLPIAGRIQPPGTIEGGDVCWLDERTLAVGRGYRTNDEGIRQLRTLLAGLVDEIVEVALPHWRGTSDVMHLMSLVSPVDRDLAVVYSRLLPVPFRERLLDRGIALVEVPDEEFETMGTNVLAVAPRRCVILAGNPGTRTALERAGAHVVEYEGDEISVKGAGGPTCLTRPLTRRGGPSGPPEPGADRRGGPSGPPLPAGRP